MVRDDRERREELLADRATSGLTPAEEAELRQLGAPRDDPESWELAAAAIDLALAGPPASPLPAALERKLLAEARVFHSAFQAGRAAVGAGRTRDRRPRAFAAAGWWLAAACLVLAIAGWWPRLTASRPALRQAAPLERASDLLAISWTATGDPAAAGAGGRVEWSTSAQRGVMRFRGLPANDPARSQYQLWIFDAARDDRYPVDGGVFDVPPGAGEVTVAIDPKVRVFRPVLFAITVERPGGVVVSSREHLVLTAPVQPAT